MIDNTLAISSKKLYGILPSILSFSMFVSLILSAIGFYCVISGYAYVWFAVSSGLLLSIGLALVELRFLLDQNNLKKNGSYTKWYEKNKSRVKIFDFIYALIALIGISFALSGYLLINSKIAEQEKKQTQIYKYLSDRSLAVGELFAAYEDCKSNSDGNAVCSKLEAATSQALSFPDNTVMIPSACNDDGLLSGKTGEVPNFLYRACKTVRRAVSEKPKELPMSFQPPPAKINKSTFSFLVTLLGMLAGGLRLTKAIYEVFLQKTLEDKARDEQRQK